MVTVGEEILGGEDCLLREVKSNCDFVRAERSWKESLEGSPEYDLTRPLNDRFEGESGRLVTCPKPSPSPCKASSLSLFSSIVLFLRDVKTLKLRARDFEGLMFSLRSLADLGVLVGRVGGGEACRPRMSVDLRVGRKLLEEEMAGARGSSSPNSESHGALLMIFIFGPVEEE